MFNALSLGFVYNFRFLSQIKHLYHFVRKKNAHFLKSLIQEKVCEHFKNIIYVSWLKLCIYIV